MAEQISSVLVVGACGGMGAATCDKLIENGFRVFGIDCYDTCENPSVYYAKADVTDEKSVTEAYNKISSETDKLSAIVYMAGIYMMDSLLEISCERMKKIFGVNLFGVYLINKTFLPLLQKGGRIIITSSELAPLDPLPFNGLYSITKAAVEKYAFSLRMEANVLGIKVSVIRPGAVKTKLLGQSIAQLDGFCEKTVLYRESSKKFRKIVNSVESKSVSPEKIAIKVLKAVKSKKPKYVYNVNRNFLLRVLDILPDRIQVAIIGKLLSK